MIARTSSAAALSMLGLLGVAALAVACSGAASDPTTGAEPELGTGPALASGDFPVVERAGDQLSPIGCRHLVAEVTSSYQGQTNEIGTFYRSRAEPSERSARVGERSGLFRGPRPTVSNLVEAILDGGRRVTSCGAPIASASSSSRASAPRGSPRGSCPLAGSSRCFDET
jgi:hypothetical protein